MTPASERSAPEKSSAEKSSTEKSTAKASAAKPPGKSGSVATQPPAENPFADFSYEQAREELIETVRALETGGVPLEETLALWERGEALASVCQDRLDGARARLERASSGDDHGQ